MIISVRKKGIIAGWAKQNKVRLVLGLLLLGLALLRVSLLPRDDDNANVVSLPDKSQLHLASSTAKTTPPAQQQHATTTTATTTTTTVDIASCDAVLETREEEPAFFEHKECFGKTMMLPNEGFIFKQRYFRYVDELAVGKVFHEILSPKSTEELKSGIVLDIGGNTGWYTALSTFCYGTQVLVFEPQPDCLKTMCSLLYKNNIQDKVEIYNRFVSVKSFSLSLQPQYGCDPGFSPSDQAALSLQSSAETTAAKPITVESINVADLVAQGQKVHLAKVDVEGNEIGVLQSLEPLMRNGQLSDVIVELVPKRWLDSGEMEDRSKEFQRMVFDQGFQVVHLEKARAPITRDNWETWLKNPKGGDLYLFKR